MVWAIKSFFDRRQQTSLSDFKACREDEMQAQTGKKMQCDNKVPTWNTISMNLLCWNLECLVCDYCRGQIYVGETECGHEFLLFAMKFCETFSFRSWVWNTQSEEMESVESIPENTVYRRHTCQERIQGAWSFRSLFSKSVLLSRQLFWELAQGIQAGYGSSKEEKEKNNS